MAIHRLYQTTGRLAQSILAYANMARAMKAGDGAMPMSDLGHLASLAASSVVNANILSAEAQRNPAAADKALQDSGGGTLADYPAKFAAIDTAAKAWNVALAGIMMDPDNVGTFAHAPRADGNGAASIRPATKIPAEIAQTIRDLPELTALISALEDAGATP